MGTGKEELSGASGASRANGLSDRSRRDLPPLPGRILFVLALCLVANGCVQVPAHRQRLVSKPNMEFSGSLVFNYQNKLLPQVEPGSTFSGGGQTSGCASCK